MLEQQVVELKGYVFGRHKKSESPAKKQGAKEGRTGWIPLKPQAEEVTRTEKVIPAVCPTGGKSDALPAIHADETCSLERQGPAAIIPSHSDTAKNLFGLVSQSLDHPKNIRDGFPA